MEFFLKTAPAREGGRQHWCLVGSRWVGALELKASGSGKMGTLGEGEAGWRITRVAQGRPD
jgi:hypothetical protein